ncbi:hypothetical protein L7F22_002134 [Adiantum nelumboides]|nr:hypothetical protein [Adiantum nelumboides]
MHDLEKSFEFQMDECFAILDAHGKFDIDTTTSHDDDLLLPMGATLTNTVAIAQAEVAVAEQDKVSEEEFAAVQATYLVKRARVDSPPPAATPVLLDPKGKSSVDLHLHPDADEEDHRQEVKVKPPGLEPVEVQANLSGAHSLYFDGSYKRKVDKASVGISIQDENGHKVFGKGLLVENTHSKNEVEYDALTLGLEWCVSMDIKRLNVFGDAHLLIKQVHGTWACRNQSLVPRLRKVKELIKRYEAIQLYHVPRKENQEADALASKQLQEVIVGAIKLQNPLFQGSDCMHDIVNFLETGECPQDMSKGQR